MSISISKGIQGVMAGAFLAATLLLSPVQGDAMEIKQFDKMSMSDRGHYVTVLFGESVRYLWDREYMDAGNKVLALFTRSDADKAAGKISPGMREFIDTLAGLRRLSEAGQLKTAPYAEHAMFLTLKKHGITIPPNEMMLFARDFKPQDKQFANDATPPDMGPVASPK